MPMQFFVPIPFATAAFTTQEPKSASDSPAPTNPGGAPTGSAGTTTPTTPPAAQPAPCMGTEMWYLPIAMIALMYFMVLRPEQKRKKQQAELLSSIKQGDHVVTVGGLHGVVSRLTDRTVTIRVESVNLTYDRVAIARVERDDAGTPPAKT